MPTEVRRLLFTPDEVCKAMTVDILERHEEDENGTVVGMEILNTDPVSVRGVIQMQSGRQVSKSYDAALLCSALIAWCMDQKIPIARKAHKAARITRDKTIALDLTVSAPPR